MEGGQDPFLSDITILPGEDPMGQTFSQQVKVDCTGIIDSLKGEFGKKMEDQQLQIDQLISSVNLLVNKLDTPVVGVARPNATEAPPGQQSSTKSTTDSTRAGSNVKLTPPASSTTSENRDDGISLSGSGLWFKSVKSLESGSLTLANQQASDNGSADEISEVIEPSQEYWREATKEFEQTNLASGPEISSSLASAAKILWHRSLKKEALAKKMEDAKIPANCDYLVPKKVNSEIWAKMGTFNRTTDHKFQEVQKVHSAATAKLMNAASTLTGLFKDGMPKEVKAALTDLKDSIALSGQMSQQLSQARRDLIKPSLPRDYKKLASEADESSELLFGSNLCDTMAKLEKESKLCALLDSENRGKRKYEFSKNSYPSSKTQRRVTVDGQKDGYHKRKVDYSYQKDRKGKNQFEKKHQNKWRKN